MGALFAGIGGRCGRTRRIVAARRLRGLLLVARGGLLRLGGLFLNLGLFFLRGLLGREDAGLAVHHLADAAGFFLGLLPRGLAAGVGGGLGLHARGRRLSDLSLELRLFGFTAGSLESGLVCRLLRSLFAGAGLLGRTGGFGGAGGRSGALGFLAFAAGFFLGGAALFLGLPAGGFRLLAGLLLSGAAFGDRTGFSLHARFLFGLHLGILHEDALSSHLDLNRVSAPRGVALLDHALFLAGERDLPLARLRALDAQAVEEPALVGIGKGIGFVRLVDAGSAQLRNEGLRRDLQFLRKFLNRHGHIFLLLRTRRFLGLPGAERGILQDCFRFRPAAFARDIGLFLDCSRGSVIRPSSLRLRGLRLRRTSGRGRRR